MSVEICAFFLQHGYCTFGDECKLYHARTERDISRYNKTINNEAEDEDEKEEEKKEEKQYSDVTEICFSFDTTGSMSCYLEKVCASLQDIVRDLFIKIPNIRISIIAHGDYCDKEHYYVIKYIDFTRDQNKLIKFVKNAGATGGGDEPECYELVLWYAAHKLKWTHNARSKALVIIGDALPHEASYGLNTKNIDWRKETELLRMMECTIYGVFCGSGERNKSFYKSIAKKTNGRCLELTSIKHICKLFVALCLRSSDDLGLFEKYKNEILKSRAGDDELSKAIKSLASMQKEYKNKKMKIDSSIKRVMYDLKEIKREKLDAFIAVVPAEDNVFKWHCNINSVQGIFKNVYIHFTLEFPSDYPSNPPTIVLVTQIANDIHDNIRDNKICLPLFGADNYNDDKSKYGSSWSAAYSIISLLINIASIFGEIDVKRKKAQTSYKAHAKNGLNKQTAKTLLSSVRKTSCLCGHSHSTPYPVLGSNKLPFDICEIDVNERYYRYILKEAIKNQKKSVQELIIKQERKDRKRGVLIAGNILETVKNGIFWCVKSQLGINRNFHNCVSWQFSIDVFDRNKKSTLYSDYIFGFVDNKNIFFGVGADGNVVYNNNANYGNKALYNVLNESKMVRIKQHDIFTYILQLNGDEEDKLFIFINYSLISCVSLPILYVNCDSFYPVMYVKDIRLHLTLDNDPKLIEIIKNKYNDQITCTKIEAFNKLQSNYTINTRDTIENAGKYYTDQTSWNELLAKALSSDILLDIFSYLNYSDLIRCKEVDTFWYSVLSGHNVLDRCEMRCFYTHESIDKRHNKCILGVGLNIIRSSNKWITSVQTEMDLLSLSAYKDYNISEGAWGETITHFLPLIINEKHSKKARKCLLKRLATICDEKTFNYVDGLMVITAIMNQFVVQLMANTIGLNDESETKAKQGPTIDPKHASEKALIGYCAFHHILLYLAKEYPQMIKNAKQRIADFIKTASNREKAETPDLGKFLLNLAIVDYEWDDIAPVFINESLDRQVKWYLRKYPKLQYLDKCSNKERIACTLKSTMISRRLVAFQVFFLQNVCKQDGYSLTDLLNNYNKRWGRPTKELKHLLMKKVNAILQKKDNINSWLEYMHSMGIKKYKTNAQICNALKKAVINSKNKEYHHVKQRKSRNKKKRSHYPAAPIAAASVDYNINADTSAAKVNISDSEIIELQGELQGHNDWITCIVVDYNNPNRIISGSRDKSVVVWDLSTKCIDKRTSLSCETVTRTSGKMVRRLRGHNHFISDVDISSDGDYILSASWDGLLRLWNIKTGQVVRKFVGHQKDILSVQFNMDNRRIISCGRDRRIYLWNTVGEIKQEINNAHNGWISRIAFSPNVEDDLFVSASYDKAVCVWQNCGDGNGYKLKHKLCGHKYCITSLSISPDGSLCATGDKYGVLCLWDIDSGSLLSRISAESGGLQINDIVFSPNRYWACFAIGNVIEIWDLESKSNVATLKKECQSLFDSFKSKNIQNNCNCIAWSHDGKTLYAGYCDNKIQIWKLISPFDGLDGVHENNDMNAEYKPEQEES